jgi:hypothetical protein
VTVEDNKHNHDYYYVLHYILDMDWCHLVPMQAKSQFGGESFRAGRPRLFVPPVTTALCALYPFWSFLNSHLHTPYTIER